MRTVNSFTLTGVDAFGVDDEVADADVDADAAGAGTVFTVLSCFVFLYNAKRNKIPNKNKFYG